jgi:phenylpyruvate tautomerase PptA (4-oxalocrotonate tautomerase family)
MPYLKLTTNIAISDPKTGQLLEQLTQLMAGQTGKSERYVMIEIAGEQAMSLSTREPLAYLECKNIGLAVGKTKPMAAAICQVLQTELLIKPDRVYIEFSDAKADYWGWNSSTFG